ncbi:MULTISPECIES: glycosyltransferase [unclassified Vibrio]|uniref:glycosyltransferase n=1 Tax=unclassified Vibrio TaxID=2614977 RepID=UPI0035512F93
MNNLNSKCAIIIPALNNKGPVKGAIALYNLLSDIGVKCTLVVLKETSDKELKFSGDVIRLGNNGGLYSKAKLFGKRYHDFDYRVSFCFSADVFNLLLGKTAKKITSVRANNFKNYHMDYGFLGLPLAFFHYMLFNFFDKVIAISKVMVKDVSKFVVSKDKIVFIGNFIDKPIFDDNDLNCRKFDSNVFNICFVGNLVGRKRIDLLIESIPKLRSSFSFPIRVNIIGDGDLKLDLKELAKSKSLNDDVNFYGEMSNPLSIISKSDLFVLPSLSEGVSRAMLESLSLGVPVLARDIDANSEIVFEGVNGHLFVDDDDFYRALERAVACSSECKYDDVSVPLEYTLTSAVEKYARLLGVYNESGK